MNELYHKLRKLRDLQSEIKQLTAVASRDATTDMDDAARKKFNPAIEIVETGWSDWQVENCVDDLNAMIISAATMARNANIAIAKVGPSIIDDPKAWLQPFEFATAQPVLVKGKVHWFK